MAGGAGFAVRELRKLAGAPARGSFFANLSIESGVSGFRALATKATRGKNAKTPVANVPQVKAEGTKKKRVYKGRNLIEVAQFLPGWGVGAKMTKSHWRPNTYYQITDIKLNKDGRHGSAWGVYHDEGVPAEKAQKIGGVNKRQWKYIKDEPERVWRTLPEIKKPGVMNSPVVEASN